MKDLRIELATMAYSIAYKTGKLRRDDVKKFLNRGNIFNIVASKDDAAVKHFIGVAKTWAGAEKMLKAKAQELSFDERAKAFDQMKAMREEGQKVSDILKAELVRIRREEAAEKESA